MYGLSSQLTLRQRAQNGLPGLRRVIIPYGRVDFKRQGHHVSVVVDTSSCSRASYQEYTVDPDLGRLVGNVSMINRLFKIYLHAITSHCLPDPLTGRTGTEEAWHELRSAGCFSFQKLGEDERGILEKISSLTPKREFYPPHLEVMQTVTWSELAATAQHHDFYTITRSILEYAADLSVFLPQTGNSCLLSRGSTFLLERAAHRNSVFYPVEFAGPLPINEDDTVYGSRDLLSGAAIGDECAAVDVSALIHRWPSTFHTCDKLFDTFTRWGTLRGLAADVSLGYSRVWLQLDLAEAWISIYNLCRRSWRDQDCFRMAFSFSALSFSSPKYRSLIPSIIAFAAVPEFKGIDPPQSPQYDLKLGFSLDVEKLERIILGSVIAFEDSPEIQLPARAGEGATALGQRRFSSFIARRDAEARELVAHLSYQWPCMYPSLPPSRYAELIPSMEPDN
jgi:hypothetical protein